MQGNIIRDYIILLIITLVLSTTFVGCVKRIRTAGGTQIDFATGFDFGVAANAIDTVHDSRGIRPEDKSQDNIR